jgi:hypothetical protein
MEDRWIDDFCNRPDFEFRKVPYPKRPVSWHNRGPTTPIAEWVNHFRYVYKAIVSPEVV